MSIADNKIARWQRAAWLCPDCGRILRKPNIRLENDNRYHSGYCDTPMVKVAVVYPA